MAARLTITVREEEVVAMLRRAEGAMDRVVEEVAQELAEEVQREAGQRSSRLGVPWEVEGTGDEQRTIRSPEWWAHFLAGGTKPHGPRVATRMVFEVDGRTVAPTFVQGIAGDPFDERAVEAVDHRVDDIIRRAILTGGL